MGKPPQIQGAVDLAPDRLARGLRNFCVAFSKSSLHVRLLAYAIGAVAGQEFGMFTVLSCDLYGQYLRKSGA